MTHPKIYPADGVWVIAHGAERSDWHSVQPVAAWREDGDRVDAMLWASPWITPEQPGSLMPLSRLNLYRPRGEQTAVYQMVWADNLGRIGCPKCTAKGDAKRWYAWWLETFWPGQWDYNKQEIDWDGFLKEHPQPVELAF